MDATKTTWTDAKSVYHLALSRKHLPTPDQDPYRPCVMIQNQNCHNPKQEELCCATYPSSDGKPVYLNGENAFNHISSCKLNAMRRIYLFHTEIIRGTSTKWKSPPCSLYHSPLSVFILEK